MSLNDPLESCPFDPVHRILRSRMQFHLTKCSKNFPKASKTKKQCPYDTRHIVNLVEYQYHISTCPARESVWRYKLGESADSSETPNFVPIEAAGSQETKPDEEENWDNDTRFSSYDPWKGTEKKPVLRTLIGVSRSKRRAFRLDERRRYQSLPQEDEAGASCSGYGENQAAGPTYSDDSSTSSDWVVRESKVPSEWNSDARPLRRPKNVTQETPDLSTLSLDDSKAKFKNPNEDETFQPLRRARVLPDPKTINEQTPIPSTNTNSVQITAAASSSGTSNIRSWSALVKTNKPASSEVPEKPSNSTRPLNGSPKTEEQNVNVKRAADSSNGFTTESSHSNPPSLFSQFGESEPPIQKKNDPKPNEGFTIVGKKGRCAAKFQQHK